MALMKTTGVGGGSPYGDYMRQSRWIRVEYAMRVSIRSTAVEDFVVQFGDRCLSVAFESEVHQEFDRLPAHQRNDGNILEAKCAAFDLVRLLKDERKNGMGAAHRTFKRLFPNGYALS
jgi:hypothetical protein